MRKSKFLTAGVLLIVLVFGMALNSCATTYHSVEINNVRNIREVYIRNAGTTNWGANLAGTLEEINRYRYSNRVDIRVIDTSGVTYSKFNVPFDDTAFIETSKENYSGLGTSFLLAVIGIPLALLLIYLGGGI